MKNGTVSAADRVLAAALLALAGALAPVPASAATARPKYYVQIREVQAGAAQADAPTLEAAREVLQKELAARPEFTFDVGGLPDEAALVAELKRRKLVGFNVSLKLEDLKREPKPPRPGGRLKQMSVGVKLSVFGATIPEAKLAFGGDGEALVEAEVVERRLPEETAALTRDALVQAVKQAVDQAVKKLALPRAKPLDESKRRRR